MSKNTPFFSNFMEAQTLTTEETKQAAGGLDFVKPGDLPGGFDPSKEPIYVTMKHPSDDDEGFDAPAFLR
ncbi:microviridin/marinostatin family tricyclic proteinase inhibitor [Grimontia sp. S25]|uniref:Microviridin/marinostatin family tricyclic proteinase inhibitor n=1 Tax=Grimontia sedimenti TaxID=2711294 RepID=A0A6M1R9I5_9GAMM|nr:microviridin/marinostatin family tricyclic proteinase inhibitor [Grimontia sedimenti]NGN96790.1 microviridin/marinostatin family tricyclic proteinase inhibitor [Grimontia sedimenti]